MIWVGSIGLVLRHLLFVVIFFSGDTDLLIFHLGPMFKRVLYVGLASPIEPEISKTYLFAFVSFLHHHHVS